MASGKKHGLPVSAGDVFTLLFLLLFVAVGVAVLVWSIASGQFEWYFALWCGMFIGIPSVIAYGMFGRFIKLAGAMRSSDPYKAKVVGHVPDSSMTVNGRPVSDLDVSFRDSFGNVRDETVDANLVSAAAYPVGSTVDVYEHGGRLVLGSRGYDERLPMEEDLMGHRAHEQERRGWGTTHVASCPCCGASLVIDERWRLHEGGGQG